MLLSDNNRRGKVALMTASIDSESARLTDSSSSDRVTSGCSGGSNNCSRQLLQPSSPDVGWDSSSSSYADGNTEDPSGYMDQTLTRIDEADFEDYPGQLRSDVNGYAGGDAQSVSEDSIIDVDYTARLHQNLGPSQPGD